MLERICVGSTYYVPGIVLNAFLEFAILILTTTLGGSCNHLVTPEEENPEFFLKHLFLLER